MKEGARIRLSTLGKSAHIYPTRLDREGVYLGPGDEYPDTVRVKWDKGGEDVLAKRYIEEIQ